MTLTNNFLHNQNYITGAKEYDIIFDFTIIKNKESKIEYGAFFFPIILFTIWISVGIGNNSTGIGLFMGTLLGIFFGLFLIFYTYKILIIRYYKKRFIVYKTIPICFKTIKKGYWKKKYYSGLSFREGLLEKYFIVIDKNYENN